MLYSKVCVGKHTPHSMPHIESSRWTHFQKHGQVCSKVRPDSGLSRFGGQQPLLAPHCHCATQSGVGAANAHFPDVFKHIIVCSDFIYFWGMGREGLLADQAPQPEWWKTMDGHGERQVLGMAASGSISCWTTNVHKGRTIYLITIRIPGDGEIIVEVG